MSDPRHADRDQRSRRQFMTDSLATVLAGTAVLSSVTSSGCRNNPVPTLLTWNVSDAVFEQTVDLQLSPRANEEKAVAISVTTPHETLVVQRIVLAPGTSQQFRLIYPYLASIPGDYVFQAHMEDDFGLLFGARLVVTLNPYRFGC